MKKKKKNINKIFFFSIIIALNEKVQRKQQKL